MVVDTSPNEAACLWDCPDAESHPRPGLLRPSTVVEKHTEAECCDDRTDGFSRLAQTPMTEGREQNETHA